MIASLILVLVARSLPSSSKRIKHSRKEAAPLSQWNDVDDVPPLGAQDHTPDAPASLVQRTAAATPKALSEITGRYKVFSKKETAGEAAPEKGRAEKAASKKPAPQKKAAGKAAPSNADSKKVTAEKAAPQKDTAQRAAAKKAVPEKDAAGKATPDNAASKKKGCSREDCPNSKEGRCSGGVFSACSSA